MSQSQSAAAAEKAMSYMATYMAINDRFNYEVFYRMKKVQDTSLRTAGVRPDGLGICLAYNPDYVASLKVEELAFVVGHEVAHVVLHHFDKEPPAANTDNRVLHDLASDLAVNALFRDGSGRQPPRRREPLSLSNGTVLRRAGDSEGVLPHAYDLPDMRTQEAYYDLLCSKYLKKGDSASRKGEPAGGSGAGGGKDSKSQPSQPTGEGKEASQGAKAEQGHEGWKQSQLASAATKEIVYSLSRSEAWGTLGGVARGSIMSAQEAALPWETLLRERYGNMSGTMKASTYKRPSRRFGYPWCSKVSVPRDRKLVLIDTSGSVSDRDLEAFKAETDRLSEVQDVYYMTFDTVPHMEEALPWVPGMEFEFTGRVGTCLPPVLKYAEENGYKDCVIFTDGYFQKPRKPPEGVDVLWVITRGGNTSPADFGEVVPMDGKSARAPGDEWLIRL